MQSNVKLKDEDGSGFIHKNKLTGLPASGGIFRKPTREETRGRTVDASAGYSANRVTSDDLIHTRLALSLRASGGCLWDWIIKTGELRLSSEWKAQLGYLDEEISWRIRDFELRLHPDDREEVMAALWACGEGTAKDFKAEYRILHKNGSFRWVRSRGAVSRDMTGAPYRLIGIQVDITREKELFETHKTSQRVEAIGHLASGIAHDFNNILTGIRGYLEFSLKGIPEGAEVRGDLLEVKHLADRASELTMQLLAFSRHKAAERRPLSVNEVVAGMTRMLQRLVGDSVRIETSLAPEAWPVLADAGQIEQALMNLVVNARDAMPEGGILRIETANIVLDEDCATNALSAAWGDYLMLTVSDTGIGMSKETQEKMFEPFFTTKLNGKGTGLGLSTVYGIVREHEGQIRVRSALGKGTAISISLPRFLGSAKDPSAVDIPPVVEQPVEASETILLLEDEPAVLTVITRMLEREGYTVLGASDTEKARKIFAENKDRISLLITDVCLKDTTGPKFVEELKAQERRLHAMFMSGYGPGEGPAPAASDASHFLQKPFAPETLLAAVRDAIKCGKEKFGSN